MVKSTRLSDLPSGRADPRYRERLLGGLLASIEERGYPATTLADVVRHAGVSKRTFYEHFADKAEALTALYELASENLEQRMVEALSTESEWPAQFYTVVRALVQGLAEYPGLARTVLLELPASGPLSLTLRVQAQDRFADTIRAAADEARQRHPHLDPLTHDHATAIIGSIYELTIRSLHDGAIDPDRVATTSAHLIAAVLTAPAPTSLHPTRS